MAFDYLARFFIARVINNKDNVIKTLKVDYVINRNFCCKLKIDKKKLQKSKYKKKIENSSIMLCKQEIFCGDIDCYLRQILDIEQSEMLNIRLSGVIKYEDVERDFVLQKYSDFLETIEKFIYGHNIGEDEIIEKSISLAKLEQIRRSGKSGMTLFTYCQEYLNVKQELKRLLESFKKTFLPLVKPGSEVIFNPTFGIGSRIVGGADADIYIDGTLYDFKVIKKNGWSSAYATQLIGYYLLDLIAKKCEDWKSDLYNYKINRVALYNVRYEKISYYDCEKLNATSIDSIIHKISDTYILYRVFYYVRHYDDIIEKYKIPINDNNCLDWNEQQAESLECYLKEKEQGIPLTGYIIERIEFLSEIKNRIISYMKTVDTLSIIRDVLKKDYSN